MSFLSNSNKAVLFLGFSGLIPFILTAIGTLLLSPGVGSSQFLQAYLAYAAVIISFIGAVHWGLILNSPNKNIQNYNVILTIGIIPSLIAWFALLLDSLYALLVFSLAFPGLYLYETFSEIKSHFPEWYLQMRLLLTTAVTLLSFLLFIHHYYLV